MKGIHVFPTQAEGLKYFTSRVIDAANRGWFKTDAVKDLFRREAEGWDSGTDHCVAEYWSLVCLPILSFFDGVVKGGDSSMFTDFRWDIEAKKASDRVVGSVAWYGQATYGRFIRLIFRADGSARMYYDTGYSLNRETREYEPKGLSIFLNLPAEGDEDFSDMDREDFLVLTEEAD
jgi:hypothetical protein